MVFNRATELFCDLSGPLVARVPLRLWPRQIGALHDVHVPSRVDPYPAPTPAAPANVNIVLELLDRVRTVEGAVAECGVFRGATLLAMALHLRNARRKIYGFDSFQGFGETIAPELHPDRQAIDPNVSAGAFTNTSRRLVAAKLRRFSLTNVELVEGFFEETLPRCREPRFAFAHLDGDTYAAYRTCLAHFYPRLTPGAIALFDEYNDPAWPGCKQAVDEYLADKSERPLAICRDNFIKYYIVKQ
ncbi:MAG: TylF/MycF/NovP-related O-methyltransferase [Vulcanimicrobiaceae bacterium]